MKSKDTPFKIDIVTNWVFEYGKRPREVAEIPGVRALISQYENVVEQLETCSLMVSLATDADWGAHVGKENVAEQVNCAIALMQTNNTILQNNLQAEIEKANSMEILAAERMKELQIIRNSCPDRCEVTGSIAGTAQNYIAELEEGVTEALGLLRECRETIRQGLYPDDPMWESLATRIDALFSEE